MNHITLLKNSARALVLIPFIFCSYANATLVKNYNISGVLSGAADVSVDGSLWDLTFTTGRFSDIFGSTTNLAASSRSGSESFSQALLDQVFTGYEDIQFKNTIGCISSSRCLALTAYGISGSGRVLYSFAQNSDIESSDIIRTGNTTQTANINSRVWAVWELSKPSPTINVPAPGIITLMAFVILSLVMNSRKEVQISNINNIL